MISQNPRSREQLLHDVRALADQGRLDDALSLIRSSPGSDPAIANAEGVCHLRAGRSGHAVEIFRTLCVGEGVGLRHNASPVHVTNFATALLLAGNLHGCKYHLSQVGRSHPGAARVRESILRWERSLRPWQRLLYRVGMFGPRGPIELDSPPGDFQ